MTSRRTSAASGAGAAAWLLLHLIAPSPALAHPGHGEHLSQSQAITLLAGSAFVLAGVILMGARRRWLPISLLGIGLFTSSVGTLALPLVQGPCRGRPATAARLEVLAPSEGATFAGNVPVDVRVIGGRLAPAAALQNRPDEGHLHVAVDGQVVSMVGFEHQILPLPLGNHQITVEFVANDHVAFCPPVTETRRVVVRASP